MSGASADHESLRGVRRHLGCALAAFAVLPISVAGLIATLVNGHPYGPLVFAAVALGFAGKLVFPGSSIRVALATAFAIPVGLGLYYVRDVQFLALLLIPLVTFPAAAAGVAVAKIGKEAWGSG